MVGLAPPECQLNLDEQTLLLPNSVTALCAVVSPPYYGALPLKEESTDSRHRAKILCFLAAFLVLVATLYPFNPFPRNGVTRLAGKSGLKFEKSGVVISDGPLTFPENGIEAYSLELVLRPSRVSGSRTILGFYAPSRARQLLVRQYNDALLMTHDARIDRDPTRTIKFDVDHVFHAGRLVQVTLSSGSDGTVVYVDGRIAERIPSFKILREELSGQIVLGSSPNTAHTWNGELLGLAIYSQRLLPSDVLVHYKDWIDTGGKPDLEGAVARYSFSERKGSTICNDVAPGPSLEIPKIFSIPHKDFLASPVREFNFSRNYASDVLVNIVGFIPLGAVICVFLRWTNGAWRAIVKTTIICIVMSLGIEILQFYIPSRASGLTDVITNSLGAFIGASHLQMEVVRRIITRLKLGPVTPK